MSEETKGVKNRPGDEEASGGELQTWWNSVQEKPFQYLGAAGFSIVVLLFVSMYRNSQSLRDRDSASVYARALDKEDASERAAPQEDLM